MTILYNTLVLVHASIVHVRIQNYTYRYSSKNIYFKFVYKVVDKDTRLSQNKWATQIN